MPGERIGMPLSPNELAALRAYALRGGVKEAAAELGIGESLAKNRLGWAYAKLGVYGAINAFRALGWLRVPDREAP
jgi:hypothetical protein